MADPQSLTERCAANAEDFRQMDLGRDRPWAQTPTDDRCVEQLNGFEDLVSTGLGGGSRHSI